MYLFPSNAVQKHRQCILFANAFWYDTLYWPLWKGGFSKGVLGMIVTFRFLIRGLKLFKAGQRSCAGGGAVTRGLLREDCGLSDLILNLHTIFFTLLSVSVTPSGSGNFEFFIRQSNHRKSRKLYLHKTT